MKRAFAGLLITFLLSARLAGQATDAVALAAQREAEENVKRLSAIIEEVQAAQVQQQKQIRGLEQEVEKLRNELARANNNAATQESLKRLNDQIVKVDERRIADNNKISEGLERLTKLMAQRPEPPSRPQHDPVPPPTNSNPPKHSASNVTEEGYDYIVQPNDRLDLIVKAYREQKIMITSKMVMDANPNVKWEKLRVGQKLFIPKPK
jgi:TolA-binding protein